MKKVEKIASSKKLRNRYRAEKINCYQRLFLSIHNTRDEWVRNSCPGRGHISQPPHCVLLSHVTSSHSWRVKRSDLCHFWARVVKRYFSPLLLGMGAYKTP